MDIDSEDHQATRDAYSSTLDVLYSDDQDESVERVVSMGNHRDIVVIAENSRLQLSI